MKNIFNISKCSIAMLLTLGILLGIAGIGVHATAVAEETTVVTEESKVTTEDNTVSTEETTQELMPTMARGCEYNDDYYIEGEPELPVGAMPVGDPTIGSHVSASFLNFVVGLGYPNTKWYYYMQDYRLPNGQLVKYHIWANDDLDIVFHHRR